MLFVLRPFIGLELVERNSNLEISVSYFEWLTEG